jgi:hypothetical protein
MGPKLNHEIINSTSTSAVMNYLHFSVHLLSVLCTSIEPSTPPPFYPKIHLGLGDENNRVVPEPVTVGSGAVVAQVRNLLMQYIFNGFFFSFFFSKEETSTSFRFLMSFFKLCIKTHFPLCLIPHYQ